MTMQVPLPTIKQAGVRDFLFGPSSAEPAPAPLPEQDVLNTQARNQAIQHILTTLGVAGAVGIGTRGAIGASHFLGRPEADTNRSIGPQVLQIPTPVYTRKKDRERALLMGKVASPWWTIPGLTAAGAGGLYGGFKMTDWLANRKRKQDLDAEVEEAKRKYHEALMGQYNPSNVPLSDKIPAVPAPLPKAAALKADLDAMVEAIQRNTKEVIKEAGWGENAIGIGTTLAGVLALGSGIAAYHATNKRSQAQLIADAIRQREKERWARRPTEIYAVPQPVSLDRAGGLRSIGQPVELSGSPALGS